MDTSAAKHLRQISMLSGEVLATEAYHYPDTGSAVVQLDGEELVMPVPDIISAMRAARQQKKFPLKYWRGKDGTEFLGIGRAVHVVPFAQFGSMEEVLWRGYREALEHHYNIEDLPCVLFSIHFDPYTDSDERWSRFPEISFHIPSIVLKQKDEKKTVYFTGTRMAIPGLRKLWSAMTAKQEPAEEPIENTVETSWNDKGYTTLVKRALNEIGGGAFSKVVLAHECRVHGLRAFDPVTAVLNARDEYGDCFQYCDMPALDTAFISVTPERLAHVENGVIETAAVAGTSNGKSGTLLNDEKNRAEHEFVVAMISKTLDGLCSKVTIQEDPEEMRLSNVTHLYTPIRGTLHNGAGLLEVVAALHPTPAVCGTPGDLAMEYIREYEGGFRGLYAGIIGWLDHQNQGEAAVAIRSGLIHGNEAAVFSGAGIVAGSNPADETAETKSKAEALLNALRGA